MSEFNKPRNTFSFIGRQRDAERRIKQEKELAGVIEPDPDDLEIRAAEMSGRTPQIDLHGLSISEAQDRFEKFFDRQLQIGTTVIKIIHGKGTGTLKRAVNEWLEEKRKTGMIKAFRASVIRGQENAVVYALI